MLALAAAFGFIGGSLRTPTRSAGAGGPQTIRAARFELLDESGVPIAFLGRDSYHQVVLAFTGEGTDELAAFGLDSAKAGTLRVSGSAGYATLHSWRGKPVLAMGDERFATRLLLGFIQYDAPSPKDDNWGLVFRHPDLTAIGIQRDPVDGTMSGVLSVTNRAGKTWTAP